MTTVSFNEKINFQFIAPLSDYEKDIHALSKTKFKFKYEDVTKDNSPLTFAEQRKEVLITIESISVTDCAFIKNLIHNLK